MHVYVMDWEHEIYVFGSSESFVEFVTTYLDERDLERYKEAFAEAEANPNIPIPFEGEDENFIEYAQVN